jgi:hypothetical protein
MHRNYTRERVRISGRDFFWRKFAVCLVRIRTFATFVLLQRSNDAKHKIMTTIKTIISPEQYSAGFFAITPNGECFLIYNDQGEQMIAVISTMETIRKVSPLKKLVSLTKTGKPIGLNAGS